MTDNTQSKALRLANIFDHPLPPEWPDMVAAAAELRRQHARIAELEAQLSSSGFTAADMATAEARGFRDGVASVAASAGSEPVAHLWQHSETGRTRVVMPDMVVDASATWLPVGPLYLHPSPPEGAGWKWVPKILSAEMVDAWASARLPGGIAQMTDDEANRAVAQANWDSMIAAAPPTTSAGSGKGVSNADQA